MNSASLFRQLASACAMVAVLIVSSFGQVAPRRPISADNPLIVFNTNGRILGQVSSTWNAVPANLKPYSALNADMQSNKPTEAEVDAWIAACQSVGAPCMLQAQQCIMDLYDTDGAIGVRMLKKYPNFIGYQWCEFQWDPDDIPDANVNVLVAHTKAMGDNGGLILFADMGGHVWNAMGQNSTIVNTFRQYKDNVVVLDKITDAGNYYWNQSSVQGFWLTGIAGHYGVSCDNWWWFNNSQGAISTAPAALTGMEIVKSAIAGAQVYLKFECLGGSQLQSIVYPLLQKITQRKMIPTLDEVKSRTKVGYHYDGSVVIHGDPGNGSGNSIGEPLVQARLFGGVYGGGIMMPQTGRYYIIPIFPQLATAADYAFCQPAVLDQSNPAATYDPLYPTYGITGNSWVTPFPEKGFSMFANPNDGNQSSHSSTFLLPLLRSSCISLSGTLQSYTYGTVEEFPDSLTILVGNNMGGSSLARSNVTTFLLKGATEKQEPGLVISGQTSYTKNWNAQTQEYTLSVTHNGTVNITIRTSGTAAIEKKPLDVSQQGRPVIRALSGGISITAPWNCTVRVLDVSGKTIFTRAISSSAGGQVQSGRLTPGMYSVQISDPTRKVITRSVTVH
jgi:hypothetical protein